MGICYRGLGILLFVLCLFLFCLSIRNSRRLRLCVILLNIREQLHLLPLLLKVRDALRDDAYDIAEGEKKKNDACILLSHNHISATARQEQHSIHAKNIIMLRHF